MRALGTRCAASVSIVQRIALALLCIFLMQTARAADYDCSAYGDPSPPANYQIVTGSYCGFSVSSPGSSGTYLNDLSELQSRISSCTAPWGGTCGTRTISTLTSCGVNGIGEAMYDQRWTLNGSPKHQGFRVVSGGTSNCEVAVPSCGDGTKGKLIGFRATSWAAGTDGLTCLGDCQISSFNQYPPGIDKETTGGVTTFHFSGWAKYSGETCGPTEAPIEPEEVDPPEPDAPEDKYEGEECITSSNGVEYCRGPQGENCGYYNDKLVCLGKTDPDECWVNADGSRFCGDSAPTPPVPDNGTRGTKAPPDDTVKAPGPTGTENTYNYYNGGTVSGSNAQSDSGANPNRPGSVNPSTEPTPTTCVGDNCAGGDGEGGDGEGGETPELEEICTFGECAQGFMDDIAGGPIGAALNGASFSTAGGVCPTPSITGLGGSWELDGHCELIESGRGLIEALFMFSWIMACVRVFLSA